MADPVSWLMIRPGWKVVASDGGEVGEVDMVAGDETQDIFNGLAVATTALGKPRYVAAEQVAEVTDGTVKLSLTGAEAEQLPEYVEPATSAQIEPDSKGGFTEGVASEARQLEADMVAPIATHAESMGFWRRISFVFKRRQG